MTAVKTLKAGIAPGPDNLQPEIFLHRDESVWMVANTVLKLPIHKE